MGWAGCWNIDKACAYGRNIPDMWTDEENNNVYEKLSNQMGDAGYDRSPIQCREKIKQLQAEYKRIKDSNTKTG